MNPRAWAALFAFCGLLGLALLITLMPRLGTPEAPQVCRALTPDPAARLACLDGLAPSILSAELAGTGARWACQLQRGEPVAAMSLAQRECAELRARGLRDEVARFDQLFFIPLYSLMSVLLMAWLWSHARLCAAPPPRRVRAIAIALGVATVALVLLDVLGENARVLALLRELDRLGASGVDGASPTADWATLDAAARAARQASCIKWLASALWALCLTGAFHAVLRWDADAAPPRLWRGWVTAVWAAALAASVLLSVGAVAGLVTDGLRLPAQALALGMSLAMGSMIGAALAAGWGALKRGIRYQAGLPVVLSIMLAVGLALWAESAMAQRVDRQEALFFFLMGGALTPLHEAVLAVDEKRVIQLLEAGADVNARSGGKGTLKADQPVDPAIGDSRSPIDLR